MKYRGLSKSRFSFQRRSCKIQIAYGYNSECLIKLYLVLGQTARHFKCAKMCNRKISFIEGYETNGKQMKSYNKGVLDSPLLIR